MATKEEKKANPPEITEDNKKYKIGLFVDGFFPTIDGVIVGINSISKIINEHVDLTVFTAAPAKGEYDDSNLPYKVVRCRSKKIPFVKKIDYDMPVPKSDKDFCKAVAESDLDLVHIRSPFAVGKMGLRYAKKRGIPAVITLHSQYKQDFYKATRSKLLTAMLMRGVRKTFNGCDECWSVNESSKQVIRDYGIKHEPICMENGTDMLPIAEKAAAINWVNTEYNVAPDQKVILYVGRLVKVKNIFFMADVLRELKKTDLNFKMIFVGDGAERTDLEKLIQKHELTDNVVFTGSLKDRETIAKFYARADLFMFPSFYDTDGVVKKEAACQKTPIICVEGSIVANSVEDGHNAYIGANNPSDFAAKIASALADQKKHAQICETAHKELYITWDQTAKNTVERYKILIRKTKQEND